MKINKKTRKQELKTKAFMIETQHPAVGRILEVDGKKFRVMDEFSSPHEGTFIKPFTEEDQQNINEYEEAINTLAEKLKERVDIKRFIKENIKDKPIQDIKTGLYIIEQEEKGKKVEKTHRGGCYDFCIQYENLIFNLLTGSDVADGYETRRFQSEYNRREDQEKWQTLGKQV